MREKLTFILNGGAVKRYHTAMTLSQQTVAEHSFEVAMLCYLLTEGQPSVGLLLAALEHDLAEHVTGDLPAPAKRSMGLGKAFSEVEEDALACAGFEDRKLTPEELRTLKFADIFSGMTFALRELQMGNRFMAAVFRNFADYAQELNPQGNALELYSLLLNDYHKETKHGS